MLNAHADARPQTASAAAQPSRMSLPALLLRLEGLALLVGAVTAYAYLRLDGLAFALLLLAPDLAFIPYMVNPRAGAVVYNVLHLGTLPALLLAAGLAAGALLPVQLALIWLAHIGMDRAAGYGFKYRDREFKETHLQRA